MTQILVGDCLLVMPTLEANSIDAIVSDPPYGLGFMGKQWDHGVPGEPFWREALRVAKPGAHLVAFGGTRTFHRLVCAIEDAGWEVRDVLMWVYGSGFPKSLDVSKAIDKAAGHWRGKAGEVVSDNGAMSGGNYERTAKGDPITAAAAAAAWHGWGTALKPAWEPIILARKPLAGTVASNVLKFGTGALNVDACRVEFVGEADEAESKGKNRHADFGSGPRQNDVFGTDNRDRGANGNYDPPGRWPANLAHDGSPEVATAFAANDDGNGAARFFYTAKASREDRNWGCDQFAEKPLNWSSGTQNPGSFQAEGTKREARNHHPTVKPHDLMRWLCRMVTPPGGLVLDPFCGSGSTGRAALAEGFRFVGIELDAEYAAIAEARIKATQPGLPFGEAA